jgi:Fe-S cluster assembly protein SufD
MAPREFGGAEPEDDNVWGSPVTLARAIDTGDLTLLPTRRDEDWRWSDLRGLIRELPPLADVTEVQPHGPFGDLGEQEFRVVNGHVEGFFAIEGDQHTSSARLRFVSTAAASNPSTVGVSVKTGCSLLLLESYEAGADGAVSAINLSIEIQLGGRLERIVIAEDGPASITVSTADVSLAPGAVFAQTILTSGAKRQRFETHVKHPGQGASVRLDGVYLADDKRHADITTVVTHAGAGGTTSQLTKGAVAGQGRGVFQGRILVEKGADQTDARMGHHALILEDSAEVDAKPELLIFADDVQCAHGNTVGQIDEAAVFYARQRGIPEAEARALLTEAFVGEVVDRIAHEPARDIARAWVAENLRGLT